MAQNAVAQLFKNQLGAVTSQMGEVLKSEFGDQIDPAVLQATIQKFMESQDIDSQVLEMGKVRKSRKPASERKPRERKEKDPATLCEARVWGDGKSSIQCSMSKAGGGCYCTKHAKLALVTETPCQTSEDGSKRIGLFCGRIDSWQEGEEGVLPFKDQNGMVRIDWASEDMQARVTEELETGKARRPESGIGAKKVSKKSGGKKSKVPKPSAMEAQSAEELASALESMEENLTSEVSAKIEHIVQKHPSKVEKNKRGLSMIQMVLRRWQQTVITKIILNWKSQKAASDAHAKLMNSHNSSMMAEIHETCSVPEKEHIPAEPIADTSSTNEPDGEDEISIEEREYEGITFNVDPNTNKIYYLDCDEGDDEYGEVMGDWNEDGPVLEEKWADRLNED